MLAKISCKMSEQETNGLCDAGIIENPFSDPTIQELANNTISQLRDTNIYEIPNENTYIPSYQNDDGPAVMQLSQYNQGDNIPNKPESKPSLNTIELQKYQEELERKERELLRREQEMRGAPFNYRQNNWPPLPSRCCFQPCFYQDIELDIPLEFQKIVHDLYYLWLFHFTVLLANVICGVMMLNFNVVGLGIMYLLIFTPFSYICWFRPIYKAFRSDSAFNFMIFFFIFFFQLVVSTIQAIGIPGSGTVGFITAISSFGGTAGSVFTGIIGLTVAVGFLIASVGDLYFITKIHRMYRSTGASITKAQEEFTSEFLGNQHVRNMATTAAAAAVESHFSRDMK